MNEEVNAGSLTDEEARCLDVLQRLLATLPDGIATLDVNRHPSGLICRLIPANKISAEFGIHYDVCVDVFFGNFGTTFEVDFGYKSANPDFVAALSFVEKIGQAVISGKCKERAGFAGIRGTVEVDGKPYRVTHFFHPRLFPKTIDYAPYSPDLPIAE